MNGSSGSIFLFVFLASKGESEANAKGESHSKGGARKKDAKKLRLFCRLFFKRTIAQTTGTT